MKKVKELWNKVKEGFNWVLETLKKWVHSTICVIFLGLGVLVFVVINHYCFEYYWVTHDYVPFFFVENLEFNDQLTFVLAIFAFWLGYIRMKMTEEHKRDGDFNTALQNLDEDNGQVKNYGAIRSLTNIALQDEDRYYDVMLEAMWVFLTQKRKNLQRRLDISYFFVFITNNHYKKERGGIGLRVVDLKKADLIGTNLSGADLSGANLRGASLNGSNLSGAVLMLTDFSLTDLTDTDFEGAISIEDVKSWDKAYYLDGKRPKGLDGIELTAMNVDDYKQLKELISGKTKGEKQ